MNSNKIRKAASGLLFGVILITVLKPAEAITPSDTPLNVGVSAAKPNIMLMIDSSGSMNDDVTTVTGTVVPSDAPSSFTYSCTNKASGGSTPPATPSAPIRMVVNSSGAPRFCKDSTTCSKKNQTSFGSGSKSKCFDNDKNYNVAYYNGSTLSGGPYTGKKLNWYFSTNNFSSGSLVVATTTTSKRIAIAKEAATDLVDSLAPDPGERANVRLGLSRYDTDDDGGMLLSEIKDLDSTYAATIQSKIATIPTTGFTPLAETLSDIGKYFANGESNNLKLHPNATTPTSKSVNTIFSKANGTTPRSLINSSCGTSSCPNTDTLTPPILGYCQKSFVVLVSDGLPTRDDEISPSLQNYLNGSLYLDDVAKALYEMDLRPTLDATKKTETHQKNNVVTYTIGLADPTLNTNSVLSNAAAVGGGKFFFAEDAKALAAALDDTIADIASKISSSASVVANSARLDANSAIFQGKFDSADWTGSLSMFPIGASEDANGDGILNFTDTNQNGSHDTGEPTEDTNGNGKLDGGAVGVENWNAADHIPAFGSTPGRNILTYNSTTTPKGVVFACANLTASQKTSLGITNCTNTADQGVWRLNYIIGDWSHEEKNPTRVDADAIRPDPVTQPGVGIFRNRSHLNKETQVKVGSDPWLLGDIVNSNPVYVSEENYNYDKLSAADGGTSYKAFVTSKASRRKMIYVGANDGILHGFDARASGTDAGKEILAYIPNAVYDRLSGLTSPQYTHQYSVDGSPRVADAYIGGAWHTMLVSTTGAGGKAVFGLDITDPSSFGGSNVLWEISDTQSPTASDLTTDTTALRGFANNLGYTLPQASIVKMHDGSWAAIVANGYGSVNNLAVLYIINVQTGNIIAAIDTKAGGATAENGLSTPIAVDTNDDRIVDSIYAGDLLGNMWKFDVSSATPSAWKVAYGNATTPAPLFVACSNPSACDTTRQPITAKPQVGGVGTIQSTGAMVYFGTGKYFETIDNNVVGAQTQSFYGIWDNNATVAKSDLQVQSLTEELIVNGFNLGSSTNNNGFYTTKKGWYLDLIKPSATTSDGERVVSAPLLRNGRIIFNTLVPIPPDGTAVCGAASEGTSWLMELDALTGGRLPDTVGGAPWDITGDGMIDANDLALFGSGSNKVAPSRKQSKVGSTGTPGVVESGKLEYKYTSGSKEAEIEVTTESRPPSTAAGSRQSWRQLQ